MPDLEHDSAPLGELTKYTPGPFIAEQAEQGHFEVLAPNAPKTMRRVARLGGPNREANAMLFAAAPDMLAALRRAERFITNGIELGYIRIPSMPDPAVETPGIIRAAIAKAEGGAA